MISVLHTGNFLFFTSPLLFDVSGGEFLLIIFFILIFFGSKGIPDIARTLGKGMREFRNATDSIKKEILDTSKDIRKDMGTGTLDQPFEDIKKEITSPISKELNDIRKEIEKPGGPV